MFFFMIEKGYFGEELSKRAETVQDAKMNKDDLVGQVRNIMIFCLFCIFVLMYGGWIAIISRGRLMAHFYSSSSHSVTSHHLSAMANVTKSLT